MVPGRCPATDHILRPGSYLPDVAGASLPAAGLAVGHHTHHLGRQGWSWLSWSSRNGVMDQSHPPPRRAKYGSDPGSRTRVPLVRDSAVFSAMSPHTAHRKNVDSPFSYCPVARFLLNAFTATVNEVTGLPDATYRSSGSPVRFPENVTLGSPAIHFFLPCRPGPSTYSDCARTSSMSNLLGSCTLITVSL